MCSPQRERARAREQSAIISWCAMTGSLKAKPLHAVPAAPLGLTGDQWAVDSANSRAVQQIHRKARETNTNLTRRWKHAEYTMSASHTKRSTLAQVHEPAKAITAQTLQAAVWSDFLNLNPFESLIRSAYWRFSFTLQFTDDFKLPSARLEILCCRLFDVWETAEWSFDWFSFATVWHFDWF